MKLKNLLIALFLNLFVFGIYGQREHSFDNCTGIASYLTSRGDTVLIMCDSVYILNSKTLSIYRTAYDKWKTRDANLKQIFSTYESLVSVQEQRISEQKEEYAALRARFDSVSTATGAFIDKTSKRLDTVNETLVNLNQNLSEANRKLDESKAIIKEERRKSILTRVLWGLGGFGLGLVVSLAL